MQNAKCKNFTFYILHFAFALSPRQYCHIINQLYSVELGLRLILLNINYLS